MHITAVYAEAPSLRTLLKTEGRLQCCLIEAVAKRDDIVQLELHVVIAL